MPKQGPAQEKAVDPEQLMQVYKQTGSKEARSQLVLYYSYIAKSLAMKMNSTYQKYATTEEMVNQGIIALIDSLDRFDPSKGVKFSTYAFTKVRGAIIDYVRKQDWLSRRVRRMDIRISKAEDELTIQLGRSPTHQEMADYLKIPQKEYERYIYEMSGENFYSLEALMASPAPQHGLLPQEDSFNPEKRVGEEELRQALAEAIDALTEQERTVLSLYYYEDLTMKEIGQVLGVSEQRVGQVNHKLIQKLRDKLSPYLGG